MAFALSPRGFIRGENEPCVFTHPDRDLTVCLYVDDCLIDGDEDDITWFLDKISKRFKCKDAEWLAPGEPLDYLGMEVTMDTDHICLCMENYIKNMVKMFDLSKARKTPSGPLHQDPGSRYLRAPSRSDHDQAPHRARHERARLRP